MYREAKVAKEYAALEEEQVINRLMIVAKEKYEKTYILKENEKTGSIDYRLIEVLGTEWADKMIEKCLLRWRNLRLTVIRILKSSGTIILKRIRWMMLIFRWNLILEELFTTE